MFIPHGFKTEVGGVPEIIVSHQAYYDMWTIVDKVTTEVGWMGTAHRRDDGNLFIEEILLLKQECHATTTEMSPEGYADVVQRLAIEDAERGIGPESKDYRANKLFFWGHSHVNMGTSPSQQDDEQINAFRGDGCPWFIRGIFNKKRRAEFTVFFFESNLAVIDCPWSVEASVDDSRREFWEKEIEDKVSTFSSRSYYGGGKHKGSSYTPRKVSKHGGKFSDGWDS